jgi:HAD superfamily hydrolase (TIGR01549 family)
MAECAIIFDVDGVLLELTRAEEELFFQPFAKHCDASNLSRDWNTYKIRNDEDITKEICERFGISSPKEIKQEYLSLLSLALFGSHSREGKNLPLNSLPITGAKDLLSACAPLASLGIATANFRQAARLRLEHAGLWSYVAAHAFGADGGGHKYEILGRALATINLPKSKVVYIGDNLNDVEAGLKHGVHFIAFSTSENRLELLKQAGAKHFSSDHKTTEILIKTLLNL